MPGKRHDIVTITEADAALFLARKGSERKCPRSDRVPRPTDAKATVADWFLQNFSLRSLLRSLRTKKGKPITLEWIVKRMLDLLDSEDARVAERMMILDRLKDLLLLGAVQDPELSEEVYRRILGGRPSTPGEQSDPFVDGRPKLKYRRREA